MVSCYYHASLYCAHFKPVGPKYLQRILLSRHICQRISFKDVPACQSLFSHSDHQYQLHVHKGASTYMLCTCIYYRSQNILLVNSTTVKTEFNVSVTSGSCGARSHLRRKPQLDHKFNFLLHHIPVHRPRLFVVITSGFIMEIIFEILRNTLLISELLPYFGMLVS